MEKIFAVIHGFMPSKSTLYDLKCRPIIDFGTAHRNIAKFSPSGRLILIAGFGNLQGEMDIWDQKKMKKIGSTRSDCSSNAEWSADSRYIITGVLSPKLRVGNNYRIWNYDGIEVHKENFDELYEVVWLPGTKEDFPERPPSPRLYRKEEIKEPQIEKPSVYRHPHFSGKDIEPMKSNQDSIPKKYKYTTEKKQLPPGGIESKSALRNKKRRAKKKSSSKSTK